MGHRCPSCDKNMSQTVSPIDKHPSKTTEWECPDCKITETHGKITRCVTAKRRQKCPLCDIKMNLKKEHVIFRGQDLGEFAFEECPKCHERFYWEDIMIAIDKTQKRRAQK